MEMMKMVSEDPQKQKENIEKIGKEFDKFRNDNHPQIVTDGILDIEKYNNSSPKIMWVLKRCTDHGIYNYRKLIDNDNHCYMNSDATWRRIAQATAGILVPTLTYELAAQMNDDVLYDAILRTAIVNVVKDAGNDTSDEVVQAGWKTYKDLIKMQIDAYNPDIIIDCCLGIQEGLKLIAAEICSHWLKKEFVFDYRKNAQCERIDAAVVGKGNKRLLWTFAPSCRGIGKTDRAWFNVITTGARQPLD